MSRVPFSNWTFKQRSCSRCGVLFIPNSGAHRYCDPCRVVTYKETRTRSEKKHPRSQEKTSFYHDAARSRSLAYAKKTNAENAETMVAATASEPALVWEMHIRFPFTFAASKNV